MDGLGSVVGLVWMRGMGRRGSEKCVLTFG